MLTAKGQTGGWCLLPGQEGWVSIRNARPAERGRAWQSHSEASVCRAWNCQARSSPACPGPWEGLQGTSVSPLCSYPVGFPHNPRHTKYVLLSHKNSHSRTDKASSVPLSLAPFRQAGSLKYLYAGENHFGEYSHHLSSAFQIIGFRYGGNQQV